MFMLFGNGSHACPRNGLAKLEILVLLHHLTTNYRLVLTTFLSIKLQAFVHPIVELGSVLSINFFSPSMLRRPSGLLMYVRPQYKYTVRFKLAKSHLFGVFKGFNKCL
ncbi:Abscisic acid 8'-hydroxylase 3 [Platanthera guangdongensis]|uniref:Abscisic acid 8'-hydroxylase 3 n=1 Tax=Platanthera guangdongensis TaxID=2320717 RepID=A0ABR2LZW5_9ASPA